MPKKITDATFYQDVIASEIPTLVDFWAPWCGPCKILGPIMETVSAKTQGKANVFKINVDENPESATRYQVTGIPTVILFRYGQVFKTFVGVQPEKVYLDAVSL